MPGNRKKTLTLYIFLTALLFAGAAFSLSVGSAGISMTDSIKAALSAVPGLFKITDISGLSEMQLYIIRRVRLPRVLTAMLVGAGLSVSGAVFQGLFRNPLAEPHMLGVSSGAALGATIAILFGVELTFAGMGTIGICALIGAFAAMLLVSGAAGLGKRSSSIAIILTGTAASTLFSAVMSLLMALHQDRIEQVYLWTLGSFSSSTVTKLAWTAAVIIPASAVCLMFSRELNLLSMGEESAQSLGVEVARTRAILIAAVSFIVAISVSVSGVIGFVGLVVPHVMRLLLGSDHRRFLGACIPAGALFMVLCDTAARTVTAPGELPIGVITAIVGAPYLIFLIKKRLKSREAG